MREDEGEVKWLLGDHLGSTNLVYDGSETITQGYKAWGERRFILGREELPTTFRYTGQREEASIGLYYYGARWYDPVLGRFVQADSIVPGAGDSQAWDRYAYSLNNPLRYIDPDGHNPLLIIALIGAAIFFSQIPSDQYQSDPSMQGDSVVLAIGLALMLAPIIAPTACLNDGDCSNEYNVTKRTLENVSKERGSELSQEIVEKLAKMSTINTKAKEVVLGTYKSGQGYSAMGDARGASYLNMPSKLWEIFKNYSRNFGK